MNDFFLEFVTRSGCHLCDEALPLVHRAARLLRTRVIETQIESSDDLLRAYSLRIPVVRDPRGNVLSEGIIEFPGLIRAALAARIRR